MSTPNPTPCRACGRPATDRIDYVRPTERSGLEPLPASGWPDWPSEAVRAAVFCRPCAAERLASDPAWTRYRGGL